MNMDISAPANQMTNTPTMKPKPKKLTGATMGMRFMQRKTPTKQSQNQTTSEQPTTSTATPTTPTTPSPQHDDPSIPMTATASDMHGISAEIIGRRSYNNFHKSVQETYIAAVKSRKESKFDDKVEKQQITDEELLQRYEKYVKGKGDMGDTKARGIGSLKKRKRQKA